MGFSLEYIMNIELFFLLTNLQLFGVLLFLSCLVVVCLSRAFSSSTVCDVGIGTKKCTGYATQIVSLALCVTTWALALCLLVAFNGGTPVASDSLPWWFYPSWVTLEILVWASISTVVVDLFYTLYQQHSERVIVLVMVLVLSTIAAIFVGMFFLCAPGTCQF